MTDTNKCNSTIEIQGELLTCCRSDPNHEKKGLWHRKEKTYW